MNAIQVKIVNALIGTVIPLPEYATQGSAGLDLRACIESSLTISSGETHLIPTGIAIFLDDPGYAGLVLPRSGLGHTYGIVLGNLVGLIDSDYQGELKISCWNRSHTAFTINQGDRIAQLVIVPVQPVACEWVNKFAASQRGTSGFGASGRQ